jgi:predicted alpha-1,6-mannanase (GH76 family)
MRISRAIKILLATAVCSGCLAQQPTTAADRLDQGMALLMRNYNPSTGLWDTEGWWNDANSVNVLGEAEALEPGKYDKVLATALAKGQTERIAKQAVHAHFINKFYDDEGWWALAWIQAYDVTHRPEYLKASEVLFDDISGGWDNTCGGGVWWNKDRNYKNAIANELFLSVAAHLANRTDGKTQTKYLNWAVREWTWFAKSGMFNTDNLINDGLTKDCKNNGRNTWSYNQGVVLGGLVELSRATRDAGTLTTANTIAHAAIHKLVDKNGVLHDASEPHCSGDTVQFKGIFVRNLLDLQKASPQDEYASFVRVNADSVWNKARLPGQGFSCSWTGPAEDRGAGATTSALAPLLGAAELKLEDLQ